MFLHFHPAQRLPLVRKPFAFVKQGKTGQGSTCQTFRSACRSRLTNCPSRPRVFADANPFPFRCSPCFAPASRCDCGRDSALFARRLCSNCRRAARSFCPDAATGTACQNAHRQHPHHRSRRPGYRWRRGHRNGGGNRHASRSPAAHCRAAHDECALDGASAGADELAPRARAVDLERARQKSAAETRPALFARSRSAQQRFARPSFSSRRG